MAKIPEGEGAVADDADQVAVEQAPEYELMDDDLEEEALPTQGDGSASSNAAPAAPGAGCIVPDNDSGSSSGSDAGDAGDTDSIVAVLGGASGKGACTPDIDVDGARALPATFSSSDFLRACTCAPDVVTGIPPVKCILGECTRCGPSTLNFTHTQDPDVSVGQYKRIDTGTLDKNGRKKKVVTYVLERMKLSALVLLFVGMLQLLIPHHYLASWQTRQFQLARTALSMCEPMFSDTVLTSADFAEKLAMSRDMEVQSVYYSVPHLTLFVLVAHLWLHGQFKTVTHCFWSDVKNQDTYFAHVCFSMFISWCQDNGVHLKRW